MSTAYLFKRVVSMLLVLCISITLFTVNANSTTNAMTSDSQAVDTTMIQSDEKSFDSKKIMPILASSDKDLTNAVQEERDGFAFNNVKASLEQQDEMIMLEDEYLNQDFKSLNSHEASLNSLINQLSTKGISIWTIMSDEDFISPSGINHRTRVTYEIAGPIYANYESEQTVMIKFKLNSPSEQEISFSYVIYSGSAIYGEHYEGSERGTIIFEIGEVEKELEINIPRLVNNPTTYGTASNPSEFWTQDRVFYINCNNLRNALFDNEKESFTVPFVIENQFDFDEAYKNAKDTYLVEVSNLSDAETPGRYLNSENELKTLTEAGISGDLRTMIDTGVFSHINLPIGYFLKEEAATGNIGFKIEPKYSWGAGFIFEKFLSVDSNSRIDFNLADIEISQIGLGPSLEGNGLVQSLNVYFDYSTLTDVVYTCFYDQGDDYIEKQMNFIDKINPYVKNVVVPEGTFYFGENIPITVLYNEPVLVNDISIKVNGRVLYPVERAGTISDKVSFLFEVKEDYADFLEVAEIVGAIDLSEKAQEPANEYTLTDATVNSSDVEKLFTYLANTDVNINLSEGTNPRGEVVLSIKENIKLSNWLAERLEADRLLPLVTAKVIGSEGDPIDIPLYVNEGPIITELRGEFDAPANLSENNNYYIAEVYFKEDISEEFKLLYALSREYIIGTIVYIDDPSDLEIVYTNWPLSNKVLANSESTISLGFNVKNNATWQSPADFTWASSDETIATISSAGDIVLTGQVGTVTFMLTALNGGVSGKELSIYSETLEVVEANTAFLHVPAGVKNIEISKGNNAKVYYSTNLTESNDSYGGSGTITAYTYELYEAEYRGSELNKGELVHQQTLYATVDNNIFSYTIDQQYLVKTSVRGKYSYILEISAKDLIKDEILSATANICVKELPARAILSKPQAYYVTDEAGNLKVRFTIDHKNSATVFHLSINKNDEATPVFSTNKITDIDKELTIAISQVDSHKLLDVYTVVLKAKNEFDEAFSYDSYIYYVYNSNALSILVNGTPTDQLTMSIRDKLSTMTNDEILALNRKISLTEEISINNKQYPWSSIADKITWKVDDDSKIALMYNDGGVYSNIENYPSALFLPGSNFLLQGKLSGESFVTATHEVTGMEARLNVSVDKMEDKLYLFQVYPAQKSEITYINGEDEYKIIETDVGGRVAIYEEKGIKSDVKFMPKNSSVYDFAVIKNSELIANQNSVNDFGLYPQNNVSLPLVQYKTTLYLYDEAGRPYKENVVIRGGIYRNGVYCPNAKINGISGNVDQVISTDEFGAYVLNFNPLEFTTKYDIEPIMPEDKIEYIIQVSFPDHSHYTKIIKIDSQKIKQYRNFSYGVLLNENIQALNPLKIQNNVRLVSQTLTIDGKEQQIPELILFENKPESAVLNIELMLPGDYNKNYEVEFVDEYNQWSLFSHTEKEAYEFSSTVTLRNTFDLGKRVYYMMPGEKANLYMNIRISDGENLKVIHLPTPISIQSLIGIPKMDILQEEALKDISNDIIETIEAPYYVNFLENNDQVKNTLDFLGDYSISKNSIRLEIEPTDNPLVYKGIIKFAAGSLTRENPSGVYVADESSSEKYNFMPGLSDMKAIKKGNYISKSKAEMEKNKKGSRDTKKTYGGGAYLECEIFYDIESKEWKILVLKSDVYIGAGGGYYRIYNTWVGPIPVTAEFRTGLTAQIGLKTIANKIYDDEEDTYEIERDYITELRPYFYIYGFGGFGGDYVVASLKAGLYGQISLDQRYLWLNGENQRKNGQKITISGTTGVKFQASVLFVEYTKKYELGGISKSWKYNDFDEIDSIYTSKSDKMFLSSHREGYYLMDLQAVSEAVTLEDRSYLNTFDRQWYAPVLRGLSSTEDITVIQTNAYPYSNPVLTDDGTLMAYISDMDSMDINDTAVCFTKKDAGGTYSPGTEIDASSYADTDVVIDGSSDNAVIAWTRLMDDLDKRGGEKATFEDVHSMMSSTEVMASIYNGTDFMTTRLTNNSTPDMSPVTATNGNKAIVAWRSLFASDMEKPLDFDGRDHIMYSIFDGTHWNEARCLYDGTIDKVKALNVKMLSDGTSAITYQIQVKDSENTEIICAVLDEYGNIINNIRLTNNQIKDENPQITSAKFSDKAERFIIGWNEVKTVDETSEENVIRLSAINSNGGLYSQFEKEIENTVDGSNYKSFKFIKGAKNLEDVSIVWTEPKQEAEAKSDYTYKDIIWGRKFTQEIDDSILITPKIKLLELDEHHVVDFFSSYVDSDTKEINFGLLMADDSDTEPQAKLAVAKSSYKNNLVVEEIYFSHDDLLPGLDIPVLFKLYNQGVEPIRKVTVRIADQSTEFDENINPGEYENFTVFYTVPKNIENPDFEVITQFSTSTDTKIGTLNMDIPDVGIYHIDIIKEMERERIFSVQLRNSSFSKLTEEKHVIKLEVYDTPDFNNIPIVTKTIADAESLRIINDGIYTQNITLSEEILQDILDENGEIPKEGCRIYFNLIIEEEGTVIDDADISNNAEYVKIYSLLTKNSKLISVASLMQVEDNHTIVQVEALNNSMNPIRNGNLIVNLRDQEGNIIETQQTYNASHMNKGLISVDGEEAFTKTFNFSKAGAFSDVVFSKIVDDSWLLSELKFKGVPLIFDGNVYNYSLQVADLSETLITVAAENPSSVITIKKDGELISSLEPCALHYGINIFEIVIKTNEKEVTYTVAIQKINGEDSTYTLTIEAPAFAPVTYGYGQPVAQNLTIKSSGNKNATISSIELRGANADAFVIINGTTTVDAGGINTSYKIKPVTNLNPGTYTATIIVTYDGGARTAATITFKVNKASSSRENEDIQDNKEKEQSKKYENPFLDISKSEWYYEAVKFVYENGLMIGMSSNAFSPNTQTTRGMLLTVLYGIEGRPNVNNSNFIDVSEDKYYAKAIAWGQESGIVKGISQTQFAPNMSITREQLAMILYNYAAFKGYDRNKIGDMSAYRDTNMISDYALSAMEWAVGTKLIIGRSDTEIAPKGNTTRAEMAAILQRFIELVVNN